jgi:hypothetical protein
MKTEAAPHSSRGPAGNKERCRLAGSGAEPTAVYSCLKTVKDW